MTRGPLEVLIALLLGSSLAAPVQVEFSPLTQRPWFESRTAHFHTYSCAGTQAVAKLAARLEQFNQAYAMLAGAQAVASPPIVVMAYPNHGAMEPFLPLYQDKPANLGAFFCHGSDENLIVLSFTGEDADSLDLIFHEYAHLLLRRNDLFWPLWLKEGMAEIYSTFEVTGSHSIRLGQPIQQHLQELAQRPLLPLSQLFAVVHGSPEYNERERQGMFYAESWLLTHYLMLGDNPVYKARFGQLTTLLRQGQPPERAFTLAFQTTLPAMENLLRGYLERGQFAALDLSVPSDLSAPRLMTMRALTPVEIWFRLGDELLRIGRLDSAESYFTQARKLAPASPLPYQGLGLLAAERHRSDEAVGLLHQALQLGSTSFLTHYVYARERFQLTAHNDDRYAPVNQQLASEIRSELLKSLQLMPDFGPAHHLLGFFELVQGTDLASAEAHLQSAIQLEPENPGYLPSLAQAQLAKKDSRAARGTLEALRLPYVEAHLRADAEELLKELK